MDMDDVEDVLLNNNSEDESVPDDRKHRQLIDAISSLDGKKRHRLSQRTVLSNNISEFTFSTSRGSGSKVHLNELVGTLKETSSHASLKGQLQKVDKKKLLVAEPLLKHEKARIARTVAYEKTSKDVARWDPLVHKNRLADQLEFPLQKQDFRVITTTELVKRFQPRTPLEMQVAALLHGSDNVIKEPNKALTPAEERALRAMDIKEARERRQELMKHRALLSYKEAKAKWQKKIKSKRYHRILKKEKLKVEKKHLDNLANTDPEEYMERLKQLEKDRVEERVSQKHRGGSKFARRQMIYAKYDDRAREQVQEMIRQSKQLTQKLEAGSDSGEEDTDEEMSFPDEQDAAENVTVTKGGNPWMTKPSARHARVTLPKAINNQQALVAAADDNDENEIEQSAGIDDTGGVEVRDLEAVIAVEINDISENLEKDNAKIKARKRGNQTESGMMTVKKAKSDDEKYNDNDEEERDDVDKIFLMAGKKMTAKQKKNEKERKRRLRKKLAKKEAKLKEESDKPKKSEIVDDEDGEEDANIINESLTRKKTLEDIDHACESDEIMEGGDNDEDEIEINEESNSTEKSKTPAEAYVDPNKLFQLESRITSSGSGPNIIENDDDEDDMDPNEQQRLTIAQAFADDDVIEQFAVDKEETINNKKGKDIDLNLPGWGNWAGDGLKPRRNKRFIIKAPPPLPRKDERLGNVIINEDKITPARKHQVSKVPFPFRNAEQFEKSIRNPLGRTWNPENAFQQLTKPQVVTHLGQVITPMDKSELSKFEKGKDLEDFKFTSSEEGGKKGKEKTAVFKHKRNINKKHNKKRN